MMKKYIVCLFFISGALFMVSSAYAIDSSDNLSGKLFRISCATNNGGRKYLEAFPLIELVKPRPFSSEEKDQLWALESSGSFFKISCATNNDGRKYLEAFPKEGDKGLVRLKPKSSDNDQLWALEHRSDENLFKFRCSTNNSGIRYLEAFPQEGDGGLVRPRPASSNKDQLWALDLEDTDRQIKGSEQLLNLVRKK